MVAIRAIVAVSPDGVIGYNGSIPWKKSLDLKRFKATTMGGTLVMGRKTWESIGRRKLPGRETLVLSRTQQADVTTCDSIVGALQYAEALGNPIWIAGGAEIYDLALPHLAEIDLTMVTDYPLPEDTGAITVFQLFLDGLPGFKLASEEPNSEDPTLIHRRYVRA